MTEGSGGVARPALVFDGWSNDDTITIVGTGGDAIAGTSEADRIEGRGGADSLAGFGGNDTLVGGSGDDLHVSDGSETIVEDADGGEDTIVSLVDRALVPFEVENVTLLAGRAEAVRAGGNQKANIVLGNGFADTLTGAGGPDTIRGFDGDDTIEGGAGLDSLDGGGDVDTDDLSGFDDGATGDVATGEARPGARAARGGAIAANVEARLFGDGDDAVTGTTALRLRERRRVARRAIRRLRRRHRRPARLRGPRPRRERAGCPVPPADRSPRTTLGITGRSLPAASYRPARPAHGPNRPLSRGAGQRAAPVPPGRASRAILRPLPAPPSPPPGPRFRRKGTDLPERSRDGGRNAAGGFSAAAGRRGRRGRAPGPSWRRRGRRRAGRARRRPGR